MPADSALDRNAVITILGPDETDSLRLGMTKDEVRAYLGESEEFRRNQFSPGPTDQRVPDGGIMVTYSDADNRAIAVELASPVQVVLDGEPLLGRPVGQVRDALGLDVTQDPQFASAFQIPAAGVGLFVPGGTWTSAIEGVQLGDA